MEKPEIVTEITAIHGKQDPVYSDSRNLTKEKAICQKDGVKSSGFADRM